MIQQLQEKLANLTYWGENDCLLTALRTLGGNFIGEKNWDGVEMHRIIFGDLPDKTGDGMFVCTQRKLGGKKQLEDFLVRIADAVYTQAREEERTKAVVSIRDYQQGFIRDDGTGEPERAPEWQVIEDLLDSLIPNQAK